MTSLMDDPTGAKPHPGTKVMPKAGGTQVFTPAAGGTTTMAADEPLVGWLAIIAGPGRGHSVEIGYGMNTVGRGSGNRIALSFGDDGISSDDHFRVVYDGQNRQFHLVPGGGKNLVYIDGSPLLSPQPLAAQTAFTVGKTTLKFVPLCTADWDWSMQASE